MSHKISRSVFGLICIILFAVGCSAPTALPELPTPTPTPTPTPIPTPTEVAENMIVIFNGNECSYSGPRQVHNKFTINWTVESSVPSVSILEVFAIDQDKTIEDLADMPAEDPPPSWVTKLSYDIAQSPGDYSKSVDLSLNAAYRGGPIYIVCFSADEETALGAIGPFEVIEE